MKRKSGLLIALMLVIALTSCGQDKPLKPASGGGGSTTSATIKVAPKGEPSR
jgi:hypothetical protein